MSAFVSDNRTDRDAYVDAPDGPAFEDGDVADPGPGLILFGASGPVILGDFEFDGLEVPETIPWGGTQSLTVHKLPGGVRVIDALGRDDAPMTWSGILLGDAGGDRALDLDAMRVAGAPVLLSWGQHLYTVVVCDCKITDRAFQAVYSITCEVLRDESQEPPDDDDDLTGQTNDDCNELGDLDFAGAASACSDAAASFGDVIGSAASAVEGAVADVAGTIAGAVSDIAGGVISVVGDVADTIGAAVDTVAGNVGAVLGIAGAVATGVGSAVAEVQNAVQVAGVLTGGSPVVAGLLGRISGVQSLISSGVYATGAVLDAVSATAGVAALAGGVVAGAETAIGGVADIVAANAASLAQGTFLAAQGIVGRMAANLTGALP